MKHVAQLVAATVMIFLLQGCCRYPSSEDGAAKARALTKAQLHALYIKMEHFRREGKDITWGDERTPLPEEFARVGAHYGNVGHLDYLVFGGCVDDKAFLMFDGINGTGLRRIRLSPGERIAPEVLWVDGDSTNVSRPDLHSAKPNYALKGTSVETLDSSEPSSGASVPYLGC